MKTFRTYWKDDDDEIGDAAPRLRAVPRSAPPRPRWTVLYRTLGVVGALGTIAHAAVHDPTLITIIDVAFGGALFAVLSAWVHWNRVALSRLDEPAAEIPDRLAVRLHIIGAPEAARTARRA